MLEFLLWRNKINNPSNAILPTWAKSGADLPLLSEKIYNILI